MSNCKFNNSTCYRKILNELSSPVPIKTIDEESNSSQSQDGESQEAAQNLTGHTSLHYQTAGNVICCKLIPYIIVEYIIYNGVANSFMFEQVFKLSEILISDDCN